jgi:hypothetical protein
MAFAVRISDDVWEQMAWSAGLRRFRSSAFRIFNVVMSEINVEAIAADLEEPKFRMWAGAHGDRAIATLTKTGRGEGPWWRDLV